MSNAIKFTDQGSVSVRIEPAQEAGHLRISVEDTGCGLDAHGVETLFEAFSRDERVADRPGSGLGLAIVKELVTLMGGRVRVSGAPGVGATFVVTIPAPPAKTAAPAHAAQSAWHGRLDVLVAEDTRASQMLIRLMLEKRDCRVVCVEDGEAAVAAARAQDFDLILLDIQMPKMDGFEAAVDIRAQAEPDRRRPFISALTAQVMQEDQARGREAGMDHMLRKPFEDAELDALLARASAARAEEDARLSREASAIA